MLGTDLNVTGGRVGSLFPVIANLVDASGIAVSDTFDGDVMLIPFVIKFSVDICRVVVVSFEAGDLVVTCDSGLNGVNIGFFV